MDPAISRHPNPPRSYFFDFPRRITTASWRRHLAVKETSFRIFNTGIWKKDETSFWHSFFFSLIEIGIGFINKSLKNTKLILLNTNLTNFQNGYDSLLFLDLLKKEKKKKVREMKLYQQFDERSTTICAWKASRMEWWKISTDQIVVVVVKATGTRYRKLERGYLRSYPRAIPRVANSHVLIRAWI